MLLYSVNAITTGTTESQGEVTVRLQHAGRIVNGVGADPDIVVASAKAYLAALNKLHSKIGAGRGPGLRARVYVAGSSEVDLRLSSLVLRSKSTPSKAFDLAQFLILCHRLAARTAAQDCPGAAIEDQVCHCDLRGVALWPLAARLHEHALADAATPMQRLAPQSRRRRTTSVVH